MMTPMTVIYDPTKPERNRPAPLPDAEASARLAALADQARAVAALLPPETGPRRVAADRLGLSRQAIDQALHAAGYPALLDALALLESSE